MGTLTITTTAPQDARIIAAFGRNLGLGRDATGPEVKAAIIKHIQDIVLNYERRLAEQAAIDALQPLEPE
jgi:hypothetical protein